MVQEIHRHVPVVARTWPWVGLVALLDLALALLMLLRIVLGGCLVTIHVTLTYNNIVTEIVVEREVYSNL